MNEFFFFFKAQKIRFRAFEQGFDVFGGRSQIGRSLVAIVPERSNCFNRRNFLE